MQKYTHLLFDADGTLLDFTAAEEFSFFYTLGEYEVETSPERFARYREINRQLWMDLEQGLIKKSQLVNMRFSSFFEEFGIARDPIAFNHSYLKNLAHKAFLIDHAYEVLKTLSKNHTIIIVTNGVAKTQYERLDTSTLMPFISDVIVSEEAGFLKPGEGFFEYTFQKCGLEDKSAALVIGDSLSADMKGAENFGLDSCWYNPQEAVNDKNIPITYEIKDLRELYQFVL